MTQHDIRSHTFDAIVIGAGLNGLTAATTMARSGRKVLVLESRSTPGGLASGSEFHPGYHSPGLLHDTTGLLPQVVETLNLTKHGLRRGERPPTIFAVQRDGRGLLLHHDPNEAAKELNSDGTRDAESYARFRSFISRIKPVAERFLTDLPPDWMADGLHDWKAMLSSGLALRRLGKTNMMELLRLGPMSVADWLNEQFESPALKSALAAPALRGCWGGPHSPGTNGSLLRYATLAGAAAVGGPHELVTALLGAARSAGVDLRLSKPVAGINVATGSVSGVTCEDGDVVHSKLVLSSCDPKRTFLHLVGAQELGPSFEQDIRAYRMRGMTACVNLALRKPLRFRCRPEQDVEFATTAQSLMEWERSFDAVKYGGFIDEPALEVYVPSFACSGAAPAGHASVALSAHGVPYDLAGGWHDEAREKLGDAIVRTLSSYVDDLEASIVAREVLTPVDIEMRYSVTGGHTYHGEHGLDQLLVRPARQCARYATPISGLYLCGSGSHPGGGITCAPGFIAANTILKNRR